MKKNEGQMITGRRNMLKLIGLGSASMLMGNLGYIPSVDKFNPQLMPPRVNPRFLPAEVVLLLLPAPIVVL